jgi:2-hydroxychromene-2-carboxylate isomerase
LRGWGDDSRGIARQQRGTAQRLLRRFPSVMHLVRMVTARFQFLFDYASPWGYLANELLSRRFGRTETMYVPVYLRGFEAFSRGLPYSSAKLQYIVQDLRRCSEHEGIKVIVPSVFPVNGLYALRGAIAAQREGSFRVYHDAIYRATWQDGHNISDKNVVTQLVRDLGLPAVADALDDPAVKEALRANTEDAAKRGVFGVPTFFVGEELFWGHDRMDYVARALSRSP